MTRPSSFGAYRRRRRPMNLSRGAFRNLAATLGVAALFSASIARAQWTLLTADATQSPNLTINTWTPAAGLSVTNQSGKLSTIPTRDIVALTTAPKAAPGDQAQSRQRLPSVWKLALRNGDMLFGKAAGFSGQSFLFDTPELGQLAIPLKSVATLSSGTGDTLPTAATDKDIVYLANNDHLDGIIADISDSKLQLATKGADKNTEIPLANVASISFGGAKLPRTVPPLSIRLTFTSGSMFTIPTSGDNAFSWSINKITLTDAAGKEHTAPTDLVAAAELLGGRVVYLTELDPANEAQVSFLGTHWPAQMDKNVMGTPLRVTGTSFAKGIGVHTQSTLVYELDGSFDTLALRVGLDDSASPQGEARASIVLDGKTLWQSQTLKPGEISPQLDLPITGGKRLELHADPTTHLDVLGRLDWLDIAMKRK